MKPRVKIDTTIDTVDRSGPKPEPFTIFICGVPKPTYPRTMVLESYARFWESLGWEQVGLARNGKVTLEWRQGVEPVRPRGPAR